MSEPFGSPKDRFYEIEKEIGEFESSWCRSDEVLTIRVRMWNMRCELYQSARRNRLKWSLPGLLIVALIAVFANPPDQAVTSPDIEFVKRVVDGDTLLFGTGERGRLIGIDTPETKHPNKPVESFGKEASAFTRKLVEASAFG